MLRNVLTKKKLPVNNKIVKLQIPLVQLKICIQKFSLMKTWKHI